MPLSLDDGCISAREHDGQREHRLSRSSVAEMLWMRLSYLTELAGALT